MRNAFVTFNVCVACTPDDTTLRRVLQRGTSTTLPMRRFGAVPLPALPALFLCGLDAFGFAAHVNHRFAQSCEAQVFARPVQFRCFSALPHLSHYCDVHVHCGISTHYSSVRYRLLSGVLFS